LTPGTTPDTFQGKEALVVIFVLGGGSQGARRWAAQSPNLVNVAVTRAKKELYVIGNQNDWKNLPFFDVLAENSESNLEKLF
jgi:superfamily I DNA and/or RNA helicase